MRFFWRLSFTVLSLISAAGNCSIGSANDLVNRFLEEAPIQWENAFPACENFSVTFSQQNIAVDGKPQKDVDYLFVTRGNSSVLEITEKRSDITTSMIWGFNGNYEYELFRTEQRPCALVKATTFKSQSSAIPDSRLSIYTFASQHGWHAIPYLIPINVLSFPSDRISIVDATQQSANGENLVCVEFAMNFDTFWFEREFGGRSEHPDDRGIRLLMQHFKSMLIWFDPGNHWLPVKAEIQEKAGAWNVSWSYKNIDDRVVPDKIEQEYVGDATMTFTNFNYSFEKPSVDRFTLTHYGLPEPSEVKRQPAPLWLAFFVAGVVIVGLASFVKTRNDR